MFGTRSRAQVIGGLVAICTVLSLGLGLLTARDRRHHRSSVVSLLADEDGALDALVFSPQPPSALVVLPPLLAAAPTQLDFVTLSLAADLARFASTVASFCKYFDFAGLRAWLLVVPDDEVALFETRLPRCGPSGAARGLDPSGRIPFVIVPESDLVPEFHPRLAGARPKVRGYLKQMILKLAVSKRAPEAFYLVLDSDVYAHEPFAVADLFFTTTAPPMLDNVRARIDIEHPIYFMPPEFFRTSAALIGLGSLHDNTEALCHASFVPTAPRLVTPPWRHMFDQARLQRDNTRVLDLERPMGLFRVDRHPSANASATNSSGTTIVYGACVLDRGAQMGFTPMILHSAVIQSYLIPTLERLHGRNGELRWSEVLVQKHHELAVDVWYLAIARLFGLQDRSVSWTEYGLYFYAAVGSGLFDRLYAVHDGGSPRSETGILDYDRSIMSYADYAHATWETLFTSSKGSSPLVRPFLLIHSWMGYPIDEINAHLAPYLPALGHQQAE